MDKLISDRLLLKITTGDYSYVMIDRFGIVFSDNSMNGVIDCERMLETGVFSLEIKEELNGLKLLGFTI